MTSVAASGDAVAGRYRLTEPIAQGGMGSVWRARDEVLGREVAVKLLGGRLLSGEATRERFRREACALAHLSHPGIAAVHDYYEDVDRAVIVMELLVGPTLSRRLGDRGPIDPLEAAEISAQVAEALQAAHDGGVVHRDIKPSNIILTERGVKVVDFGIAAIATEPRLTASQTVLGSAAYLAPERIAGRPASPATDLYSLGVVLYEMLTDRLPYADDDPLTLVTAHLHAQAGPLPDDIPPGIADICLQTLAKDPAERPATAAVLGDQLRRAAQAVRSSPNPTVSPAATEESGPAGTGERGPADTLDPTVMPRPWRARAHLLAHRRLVTTAGAIILIGALALTAALWPRHRTPAAAAPAPVITSPAPTTATPSHATPPSSRATATPTSQHTRRPTPARHLAGPADPDAAIAQIRHLIVTDAADGSIRPDVAGDLNHTLTDVQTRLGDGHPADAAHRVGDLSKKIRDHTADGKIARPQAAALNDAVATLAGMLPPPH